MVAIKEIVLPSGRFASFREITWGDMIFAYSENAPAMMGRLVSRCCHVDGEPLTIDEVGAMLMADFLPIMNVLVEMLPSSFSGRGVA